MFRNLRTSTKLLILCGTFSVSIGVPVYALVAEMQIAIAFARKELVGSRYLVTVREIYAAVLAAQSRNGIEGRGAQTGAVVRALADAEAGTHGGLQTAGHAQSLAVALRSLDEAAAREGGAGDLVLDALEKAQALATRVGDDSNLALDPDL